MSPKLYGSVADFDAAINLAKGEKWRDALSKFDAILRMPDEIEDASKYLLELMKDKEAFDISDLNFEERTANREMAANFKMELGGAMVPRIMEARGRCFVEIFSEVTEFLQTGRDVTTSYFANPDEASAFMRAGIVHAAVSMQLLWEHKQAVKFAGYIFFRSSNLEHAVACFERSLELEPGDGFASRYLNQARSQLSG